MESYKEKVVVITGGATGIGFSFAKQFGNESAKIVITGRRKSKVNNAVQELSELGFEAKGTVCDVTIKEQVEALADFAWKELKSKTKKSQMLTKNMLLVTKATMNLT